MAFGARRAPDRPAAAMIRGSLRCPASTPRLVTPARGFRRLRSASLRCAPVGLLRTPTQRWAKNHMDSPLF